MSFMNRYFGKARPSLPKTTQVPTEKPESPNAISNDEEQDVLLPSGVNLSAEVHGLLAGVHYLDTLFPSGVDTDDNSQDEVCPTKGWPFLRTVDDPTVPILDDDQDIMFSSAADLYSDEPHSGLSQSNNPPSSIADDTCHTLEGQENPSPNESENSWLNPDGSLNWSWSWSNEFGLVEPLESKSGERSQASPPRHPSYPKNTGKQRKKTNRKPLLSPLDLDLARRVPGASQWTSVWTLRVELQRIYKRLRALSYQNSHSNGSRRPHKMYKDATHMLEVGLLTFEYVRQGCVPTRLREVFAFVCVSILMWKAIKQHKATAIKDALQDLHVWREALMKKADQAALDFLVYKIWSAPIPHHDSSQDLGQSRQFLDTMRELCEYIPSTQYLNCLPKSHVTSGQKRRKISHPKQDASNGDPSSQFRASPLAPLLGYFQRHVNQTLAETASHSDLRFADFLNTPFLENPSFTETQLEFDYGTGVPGYYWTPNKIPMGEMELSGTTDIWRPPEPELWQSSLVSPPLLNSSLGLNSPLDLAGFEAHNMFPMNSWHQLFGFPCPQLSDPPLFNSNFQEPPIDLSNFDIPKIDSGCPLFESQSPKPQGSFINPHLLELPPDLPIFEDRNVLIGDSGYQLFESSCPNQNQSSSTDQFSQGLLTSLIRSFLFLSVLEFLCHILASGNILSIFSGCSKLFKRRAETSAGLGSSTTATEDFVINASQKLFDPLRAVLSGKLELLGIIAVAELLVTVRQINRLRDIEEYIIHIAKHLVSSKASFLLLVKTTLFQCLISSLEIISDHTYGQEVDMCQKYSTEYVTKREIQEKEWADNNFQNVQRHQAPPSQPGLSEDCNSLDSSPNSLWQGTGSSSETYTADTEVNPSSPTTYIETLNQAQKAGTHSKILRCPHRGCNKSYQGSEAHINLRRHERCIHERKEWSCPNCELRTGRRDNLRQHFIKKHPESHMPEWLTAKGRSACQTNVPF